MIARLGKKKKYIHTEAQSQPAMLAHTQEAWSQTAGCVRSKKRRGHPARPATSISRAMCVC